MKKPRMLFSLNSQPSTLNSVRGRGPSAFTLIELLDVISIIAILMGLLFPAFKSVQDQAKKTQAKNDMMQIVTAVNAYNTDYGVYPLDPSKQGFDTLLGNPGGTYDNSLIFDVLRAQPNGWNSNNILEYALRGRLHAGFAGQGSGQSKRRFCHRYGHVA